MLIELSQLLKKYNLKPTGVFHVGASSGQEAKSYNDCGLTKVIWIEAIPKVFNQLKERIKHYPEMYCINACVSDKTGEQVTFHISSNEAQSSSMLELGTHKTEHPDVTYVEDIQLTTKRLDYILKTARLDISEYNFLNLDLQGAELLALKGLGDELNKVEAVYCEVNKAHLYVGCPLIEDIDAYLSGFGFKRVETEWCGNFNWGDALYIR